MIFRSGPGDRLRLRCSRERILFQDEKNVVLLPLGNRIFLVLLVSLRRLFPSIRSGRPHFSAREKGKKIFLWTFIIYISFILFSFFFIIYIRWFCSRACIWHSKHWRWRCISNSVVRSPICLSIYESMRRSIICHFDAIDHEICLIYDLILKQNLSTSMRKIFFVINQKMMQGIIFKSFAYHFATAAIFIYNYINLIPRFISILKIKFTHY